MLNNKISNNINFIYLVFIFSFVFFSKSVFSSDFSGASQLATLISYAPIRDVEVKKFLPSADMNEVNESGSDFKYYPVSVNKNAINSAIEKNDGVVRLPSIVIGQPLIGKISSVDSTTSNDGAVVYFGRILDADLKLPVGDFSYAFNKGAPPYIYVSTKDETYEIIGTSQSNDSMLLKRHLKKIMYGKIDYDEHEENDAFLKNVESSYLQNHSRSASCQVVLGVGYTMAAYQRNYSIYNSIITWVADLNGMLAEVGSSCRFLLVQRSPLVTGPGGSTAPFKYTEVVDTDSEAGPDAIFYDLYRMSNVYNWVFNTPTGLTAYPPTPHMNEIRNWKSSVNADIFVLITRADRLDVSDKVQGVAMAHRNRNFFRGGDPTLPASMSCDGLFGSPGRCGQFAVVRDNYAYSFRVFAHEIGHLLGLNHTHAYGENKAVGYDYDGGGFIKHANNTYTEEYAGTPNGKATTVMTNGNPFCSSSHMWVNTVYCNMRLPVFASRYKPRTVIHDSLGFSMIRYFPEAYPFHTQTPYNPVTPYTRSTLQMINHGMNTISQFE